MALLRYILPFSALAVLLVSLFGCQLSPLNERAAASHTSTNAGADIYIAAIPEREGQLLHSYLVQEQGGNASADAPLHLSLRLQVSAQQIVAIYSLTDQSNKQLIMSDSERMDFNYSNLPQSGYNDLRMSTLQQRSLRVMAQNIMRNIKAARR